MTFLDDLEQKARAATPGPWGVRMGDIVTLTDGGRGYPIDYYIGSDHDSVDIAASCDCGNGGRIDEQNASYIAAVSPDVVLKLVAVARAAQAIYDAGDGVECFPRSELWAALDALEKP